MATGREIMDVDGIVREAPEGLGENVEHCTADIRHNMIVVILLDSIFAMGFADLNIALQPLLVYLNASNATIGLATGATSAGLLGLFLSPWISRRFRVKKWYMFVTHLPYLGALGMIGLVIVLSRRFGIADPLLLKLVFCLIMAHWFFAGFVALPHQEYVAACIPMSHRGRYNGLSSAAGAVLGIVSSVIGGWILLRVSKPMAFGYLFLMTWAISQSGYIAALFAREKPTPVEKSPKPWSKDMIKCIWDDKGFFRLLLLGSCFGILVLSATAFVPVYGYRELHMIPATAAVIQLITMIIRIGLSALIGVFVDKISPKRVYPYMMLVVAASLIPVILIRSPYAVYTSIAINTVFSIGFGAASMALLYGLPSPEKRSSYFTVSLIISYLVGTCGPVVTGLVLDVVSYRVLFGVVAVIAVGFYPFAKFMLAPLSDHSKDYF
ncbi:MAG: MFS transporter [Armatimonadota bacterium]